MRVAEGKDAGKTLIAAEPGRDVASCQLHDAHGKPARAGDGDLLAEDRAHRELEAAPRAGRAQARTARDERRERMIAGQMRTDGLDVGIEIEQAAQARDDGEQRGDARETDRRFEMGAAGRHDHAAEDAVDLDRAGVAVLLHQLDAGDGTRAEEGEDGVPIVGARDSRGAA